MGLILDGNSLFLKISCEDGYEKRFLFHNGDGDMQERGWDRGDGEGEYTPYPHPTLLSFIYACVILYFVLFYRERLWCLSLQNLKYLKMH